MGYLEIALCVSGWTIAVLATLRLFKLERAISKCFEQTHWLGSPHAKIIRNIALLAQASFEGDSLNNLLRSCHTLLEATGVELVISPDMQSDRDRGGSSTSVRLTSGRPVTSAALTHDLKIGTVTIGHLRLEVPPLDFVHRIILNRLATAMCLQLIAQRTNKELKHMSGIAVVSERARTGFIASLSHELRGPLGMVLNAVELVRDELCGPINPDQKETLGLVHGNVHHLLNLVNDVLDFAKTESGTVVPRSETIALKDTLEELVGSARGQADAKNQRLSLNIAKPIWVLADARHTRQIILNLLTNAVKYTPNGGTIAVTAKQIAETVTITVTDSGVGIPEQEFHKVFAPFQRVSTGLKEQGTGLGMPLSKLLAEKNFGTISFESQVGKGTSFTLTLPASISPTELAGAVDGVIDPDAKTVRPAVNLKGQSVLIASRDQAQLGLLSRALVALDASVSSVTVNSGFVNKDLEGHDESASKAMTAIIIDSTAIAPSTDCPFGDVSQWVAYASQNKVPLVVLTPRAFEFDTAEYLKLGVDVCVAKPFQTHELAQTLSRLKAMQK